MRYFRCACCGAGYRTNKEQDPERDRGFGTCERCHEFVARSWVRHGFRGERSITLVEALERLTLYA